MRAVAEGFWRSAAGSTFVSLAIGWQLDRQNVKTIAAEMPGLAYWRIYGLKAGTLNQFHRSDKKACGADSLHS